MYTDVYYMAALESDHESPSHGQCTLVAEQCRSPPLLERLRQAARSRGESQPHADALEYGVCEFARAEMKELLFPKSARQDSNLRLLGPKPSALAKLSYAPRKLTG